MRLRPSFVLIATSLALTAPRSRAAEPAANFPVTIRVDAAQPHGELKWGSTNAFTEDAQGRPIYDWTIVDRIFDAYLANGVKPYAQIGFMPQALSTKPEPYQHEWRPGFPYNDIYSRGIGRSGTRPTSATGKARPRNFGTSTTTRSTPCAANSRCSSGTYHDDDVTGPTADLALTLAGLAAEATAPRLTHYRVDATHSNAYTPWQSLGSPVAPTKPQYLQLEAAAQLATLANATATVAVTGGTATLAFPLPRQAVSLLVLQW